MSKMKWTLLKFALKYGTLLALLLIGFTLLKYAWMTAVLAMEIYLGITALVFLGAGLYIGARFFSSRERRRIREVQGLDEPLSPREKEVLLGLDQGLSNRELAGKLDISQNTVKTHISRIYEKLDARSRTRAIARARELGILG